MKNEIRKIIAIPLGQLLFMHAFAQDSSHLHAGSGQVARPWFWITIILLCGLFLIFVLAKSNRSKREIVKDERKEERVVENTRPDR